MEMKSFFRKSHFSAGAWFIFLSFSSIRARFTLTILSISSNGVSGIIPKVWRSNSFAISLLLFASSHFAFCSSLGGFGFFREGVFSSGISNVNFFPSDFLVKESLPALRAFGMVFWVDFEFFRCISKRNKILFFCVIIPQNANCWESWFFPWDKLLKFYFSVWCLNKPRGVFAKDFVNDFLRNSEKFPNILLIGECFCSCQESRHPAGVHFLPVKMK